MTDKGASMIEPVAYMWTDNEGICGSPRTRYGDFPPGRITDAIPLYAHPAPAPADDPKCDYRKTAEYMKEMGLPHPIAGVPDVAELISNLQGDAKFYIPLPEVSARVLQATEALAKWQAMKEGK